MSFTFTPFPTLESDRLLYRAITEKDANEVIALRGNVENMKYIPRPLVTTTEEAFAHIKMIQEKIETNEGINWVVTEKGNDKLIAIIGHYRIKPEHFRCEIGYAFLPGYHGKGYATEAIRTILKYAFNDMQMHSVEAVLDPRNIASEHVLLKNGFVKEAHLVENEYYNGKFIDSVIYSLLKRNFIQ